MRITDFNHNHIDQSIELVKQNYEQERQSVSSLPKITTFQNLSKFADNKLGVAAFENNDLLGFLCCYKPWNNAFGTTEVKGTFSPIHAHGAVLSNRDMIYKRLYQAAAEKWLISKVLSHSIGLYAHDTNAINSFFTNGFGLRFIDAIRPMKEIACKHLQNFIYCELIKDKMIDILPLNNLLISHLSQSPIFLRYPQLNESDFINKLEDENCRYFVAYKDNLIAAYIKISSEGENFATTDVTMQNICGAYCLNEYRGSDLFQNLLNFVIIKLKNEGFTRLGVDFESFNPNSYGFWLKYFTAYTYGVVRRIDERILNMENKN